MWKKGNINGMSEENFEEKRRQQKIFITKELDELCIAKENKLVKTNWQVEKEQRINPSLWWKDVADKQASQSTNTNNDAPTLTNLSKDGKAWFIHPVAMVDYFSGAGIVTYHIYQDGKIEKHIPENILPGFERKYKYVYHDKDNNKHEVCIVDWHTTKKKKNGVRMLTAPNRKDKDILEYKENVNEGNTQKRVKYKNGDIAEYGWHSQKEGNMWRKYVALDEEVIMIRMVDDLNYISGDENIKIGYSFHDTERRYTNPAVFAALIGALAENGIAFKTGGSSFEEGSCFPSANHANGACIDIHYFYNANDENFLLAMAKFHFKEILVGNPNTTDKRYVSYIPHYKKLITLGGKNGDELHNTHLHFDKFQYEIAEVYL